MSWLGKRTATKRELLSSHWETVLRSQGSPSRTPVPTSPYPPLNNSEKATPPHPPQSRSQSRPTMAQQLPTILEWHLYVHRTRVEGCRVLPAVHRCLRGSDLLLTWMEPGSEVTGDHTSNYPSTPYSGRSSLPSLQQLALGVTSWLDSTSGSTATICP